MAEKLHVLIPTAGRSALLERTLASLACCEKPAIYEATVVIENGSKREAESVVRTYQERLRARYLHVPMANKSHALNEALRTIKSGLVFFADDDVRFRPGTLCAYAEAAEGVDGGQFFGGPVGVDYEEEPSSWLKTYLPPSARGWGLAGGLEGEAWKFFLGFNWAAYVEDIKAVGGFDPNFGPGSPTGSTGQEEDMERRLIQRGIAQVFVPEAMVWHYVPRARCSARWVLKRSYRSGIQSGLREGRAARLARGYPARMVKRWLVKGMKALQYTVGGSSVDRFEAYHRFAYHCGFMRGYRSGRSAGAGLGADPAYPEAS